MHRPQQSDDNKMMEGASSRSRIPFANVLVSRPPDEQPSDLELQLTHQCERLRIAEKRLPGGAHLLLLGGKEISQTIAVRTYDAHTIRALEQHSASSSHAVSRHLPKHTTSSSNSVRRRRHIAAWHNNIDSTNANRPREATIIGRNEQVNNNAEDNNDDDIQSFRSAFQCTVVCFILPSHAPETSEQLDTCDSFFHRVQYAMTASHPPCGGSTDTGGTNRTHVDNNATNEDNKKKISRVFVVPDTTCTVRVLANMVKSLFPHKVQVKQQYFRRQALRFSLIPKDKTASIGSIFDGQHPRQLHCHDNEAASHVALAVRALGQQLSIPSGEINALLSMCPNLFAIATADRRILNTIPIGETTKDILIQFFGSDDCHFQKGRTISVDAPQNGRQEQQQQHQQQQAPDVSDDISPSRLMVDPSGMRTAAQEVQGTINSNNTNWNLPPNHSRMTGMFAGWKPQQKASSSTNTTAGCSNYDTSIRHHKIQQYDSSAGSSLHSSGHIPTHFSAVLSPYGTADSTTDVPPQLTNRMASFFSGHN